ncbi:MAG TPA: ABC transporter permease [Gemmatimonadaceae bacterium]|nr:ABC transporter permease [Gemmatimonadaceae bacterium]
MSFVTRVTAGVRRLADRDRAERELQDEMQQYLREAIAANEAAGMTRDAAERAARREIGSITAATDPARDWGWDARVEALLRDVKYAVRYLRKSPGFALAAAGSLALGIGANTAIFSMVNATLLQRLPVARSEQLVSIASPSGSGVFSYPAFDDIRRAQRCCTDMLAFGGITVSLSQGEATDLVTGAIVTGNYFDLLGVRAQRGRLLGNADDVTPGAHPVAVISDALWKRRFAGRADIVGLDVRLNGQPFTVVGVAPAGFDGIQPGVSRDIYVPMMMQAWMRPPRAGYSGEMNPDLLKVRTNSWLFAVGRLKPGMSLEQAAGQLNGVVRGMGDWSDASRQEPPSLTLTRLDDGPPGQRAQLLSVARLLGAVVLTVLIIACANVANLLLARASARRKEIAVRLSIGATRARLIRQLLTESVLLASLGGALGLALAWLAIRGVRAAPPPQGALPVLLNFSVDARVLAFTLLVSVLTGIVFGLMPALRASRPELVPSLKDGTGAQPSFRISALSARNALIVAQVALSLVLLISASLFIRSLGRARAVSPGFDADRVLTVPLNIQLLRYTREQGRAFYGEVTRRVAALPGVQAVSLVRWVPLSGGGAIGSLNIEGQVGSTNTFGSEGGGMDSSDPATVSNDIVGVDYFRTMGIAMKRGRDFTSGDDENGPPVAIVNESFARRHFDGVSAIGRRISLRGPNGPWIEIVGIVADSKYATLDERPMRIVYLPSAQNYVNGMTLVVRTAGDPSLLTNIVAREVHALDPALPASGARTLDEWIGISLYAARAGAALLTGFGALALLLAAVGLYGVLSYAVSRRTREFGVRIALGARAADVLRQVLREGMGLVLFGVVVGLAVALSATRLLTRFLYDVSARDSAAFAATSVVLLTVAAAACLIPAWRATRVDPVRALKQE